MQSPETALSDLPGKSNMPEQHGSQKTPETQTRLKLGVMSVDSAGKACKTKHLLADTLHL
jgi:hypothetical protein